MDGFDYEFGVWERRKPAWSASAVDDGLQLDVWRAAWAEVDELSRFRSRDHFFKVTAVERVIAAGTFKEWDFDLRKEDDFASLEGFVNACDGVSQAAYDMANVVFSLFCRAEEETGKTPFDYGHVTLFKRLRIQSASAQESDAVWTLIREIARRFWRNGRSRAAFIILKAFPLEYEGNVKDTNRAAFARRQRALMRLYVRRLGLKTLPGRVGKDGWQWLRMNCPLDPKPSRRVPNIW